MDIWKGEKKLPAFDSAFDYPLSQDSGGILSTVRFPYYYSPQMFYEEGCLYEGDAILENTDELKTEEDTLCHVRYRGRRPSIVDRTIHFPTLHSSLISHVLRFCCTSATVGLAEAKRIVEQTPQLSALDLLKTSTFLEIDELTICLCSVIARKPNLWSKLSDIPSHLCEEIFIRAPIEYLVYNPVITDNWWRKLNLRKFRTTDVDRPDEQRTSASPGLASWLAGFDHQLESPHQVIRKYLKDQHQKLAKVHGGTSESAPSLGSESPIKIPSGVHIHSPHPNIGKTQPSGQFWKHIFLQNAIQVNIAETSANLTPQSRSQLAHLINHSKGVTELVIRSASSDVVASALTYGFLCNSFSSLESLDLSKVGLDGKAALSIAAALEGNTSLLRLNLGNNKLKNEGSQAICKIIQTTRIKTLHLEHNGLGVQAGLEIGLVLEKNKYLTKLALGYNQLRSRGVAAIANALKINKTLTALDVANCYIGNEGAIALAEMIRSNSTLQLLRAWDSSMGREGGHAVAMAVAENHSLLDVGIGYSSLSNEDREVISASLSRNNSRTSSGGDLIPAPRPPTDDQYADRRKHERDLLYGADTVFSSQWYLIDETWLSKWRSFVARDSRDPPPGPISNDRLVDEEGMPREGLRKLYDYRGVSPQVYRLFSDLYGGGPEIVRSVIDLYAI
ncbi:hypothetical protein P9112_002421 [Eukaryota sp. TZLM1-RC]